MRGLGLEVVRLVDRKLNPHAQHVIVCLTLIVEIACRLGRDGRGVG